MKRKAYLFLMSVIAMCLFSACNGKSSNNEILQPISEHILGKWEVIEISETFANGEVVVEDIDGNRFYIIDFRDDNTARFINSDEDGNTYIAVADYSIDETDKTLTVRGATTPISYLNEDEFAFEYDYVRNPDTGEHESGLARWAFRRHTDSEPLYIERFLGKWNHTESYEKRNDEWIKTDEHNFDSWYHFFETGTLEYHFTPSSSSGEQVLQFYWCINTVSNELKLIVDPYSGKAQTYKAILEPDFRTLTIYSYKYLPDSTQTIDCELKDVYVLE